ncbi:MAG: NADH-ubiquinone oxidoreductase [Acetobacteraceae bacterium]|nr:NADH-ubiquinone oxidoreductase [Acetobacteraceae bacterium]
MANSHSVHVIGASGRSGIALARGLGARLIPVVRDTGKWAAFGLGREARIADLANPGDLARVLRDATHIVSCAHARHAAEVIAAAPPDARLVFLGSTRKFTRWPDDHGNGVLAGEAAFLTSGRAGAMLHPTMIYGAEGEDNVRRLAALTRRLPLLPLPDGGRSLVQPIHQSDVTRAILAALGHDWTEPRALIIAGPEPMTYVAFLRAVATASGARRPRVVSVPAAALIVAASLSRFIPGVPTVARAEIRRLLEDKAFDIAPMRELLGFCPISLAEGLALTFPPDHVSPLTFAPD